MNPVRRRAKGHEWLNAGVGRRRCSVHAAGHHVLIAITGRAGIGKSPDQPIGVDAFERFHAVRRVVGLDTDHRVALGQPYFTAAGLQQGEDADEGQQSGASITQPT